ncbi:hypothetical protein CBR_g26388 [Chara braunii]|uniref:Uncharacterized protein n=1 Tax=Chara braunii TaxID=69332 RepID=A0A388L7S4_CHABU|nr:hypothetical protein CBR_g26388 [Chara braunii]|eukprot:GBG78359.1 hypothetical protein CBR_g26388 [Chara braunii]
MHVVRHLRCRAVPWASVSQCVHDLAGGFMRDRYVADVQPLWGRGRCVGVLLHNSISSIRRTLSLHVPSLAAVEVGSVVRVVRSNITSVVGRRFVPEGNDITHAVQRCGGIGRIVEGGLTDRDVAVAGTVYARPYVAHPPRSTAAQDGVLGGGSLAAGSRSFSRRRHILQSANSVLTRLRKPPLTMGAYPNYIPEWASYGVQFDYLAGVADSDVAARMDWIGTGPFDGDPKEDEGDNEEGS